MRSPDNWHEMENMSGECWHIVSYRPTSTTKPTSRTAHKHPPTEMPILEIEIFNFGMTKKGCGPLKFQVPANRIN